LLPTNANENDYLCFSITRDCIVCTIDEFDTANEELAKKDMEVYYECCGKSICVGCVYSFHKSGNMTSVRFAMQTKTKQMKKQLKN
jgi:hypothetical protein